MPATFADQLIEARGGEHVVGIRDQVASSVEDAARLFGLINADKYFSIDYTEAVAVLRAVLHKGMTFGDELIPLHIATLLAEQFVSQFAQEAPLFFTNGSFGEPSKPPGFGASWTPATSADFDSGVLVLTSRRTACAWFMENE
ncbi:hypothetical protein [Variovorax paradoxus]|uniref:hypothetical protein n=1 Tax=Variovorax paradoxus TaxID=34073 RepID=UPI003D64AA2A